MTHQHETALATCHFEPVSTIATGLGWRTRLRHAIHGPKIPRQTPGTFLSELLDCSYGPVAQLAEHLVCNQGVRSSNLLRSTSVFKRLFRHALRDSVERPLTCAPHVFMLGTCRE